MSITPEGGWEEFQAQEIERKGEAGASQEFRPALSGYRSRKHGLICKICDAGTLTSKSAFRMSGPAVAIGFILLIPSVLGIVVSGLMFLGVVAFRASAPITQTGEPRQSFQTAFDASFRKNCARTSRQSVEASGMSAPMPIIEEYCECTLSTMKETGFMTQAVQSCQERVRQRMASISSITNSGADGNAAGTENMMRAINEMNSSPEWKSKPYPVDGDLENDVRRALSASNTPKSAAITPVSLHREVTLSGTVVDESSRELAEEITRQVSGVVAVHNNLTIGGGAQEQQVDSSNRELTVFSVLGGISALALGVASFVGGLLGWLLVMRKRILQCDDCGAVVNAS